MGSTGLAMCAAMLAAGGLVACGDDGGSDAADAFQFDGPGIDANPMPATLAESGLCVDPGCTSFASDVREFRPRFELYADGATKRRWIYLPPGTSIDTTDMEFWKFPVGTKLWKEFTRNNIRVETRLITKLLDDDAAPGAWYYATYAWNAAQDATTLASPQMGVMDANGTPHDIPTRGQCRQCHEGNPSRVLGFSAISLDYAAPAGNLDLDDAIAAGMLSAPPAGAASPKFALPGATLDHDAMGYLHANCGHCHNPRSATHDITPLELRLDTTKLATIKATPVYVTGYDVNGTVGGLLGKIIDPANADNSVLLTRFRATVYPPKMPPVGTSEPNTAADTMLESWIGTLPP